MFKGLSKKKTSKKSKSTEDGKTEDAPAADGEFDPSLLKKKKKKKTKTPKDFEAELAEAGVDNETAEAEEVAEGDPEAGTGIWQHDSTQAIPYALLVSRFFSVLQKQHPDMQLGKSYKMIPPNVSRQGARKSAWTNFSAICERMNRSREHVMQFTLAELGAQSGSIDKEDHLVIRGTSH
jgi:translation initiation factor 2 subunit 2